MQMEPAGSIETLLSTHQAARRRIFMVTAMRTSNLTWTKLSQDKVQNFCVRGDESATTEGRLCAHVGPRKQHDADAEGTIMFV